MTPDENRSRVLRLFDEVVNAHDATAIEGFTTNPAIAGELDGLLDAFPDLHFDVTWTVAEENRVVAFLEMSGTHEGSWLMLQRARTVPFGLDHAVPPARRRRHGHRQLARHQLHRHARPGWLGRRSRGPAGTRPDLTEPREVSVGEIGLAVDIAQNAAPGVSEYPSDNAAASRE